MTQAFNLAQLANNLNTSGQLDATDGLTGALPIANGGTGQTSASSAINALLPSQSGNSGTYLTTNGSVASWGALSTKFVKASYFDNSTRTVFSTDQDQITIWTVNYTKQSSTSNLYINVLLPLWNQQNGGQYIGLNIDGSTNYMGFGRNTTAEPGFISIVQVRTGLAAGTRSISVFQDVANNTANRIVVVLNPNSSDDARNQQQTSIMQVLEIEP